MRIFIAINISEEAKKEVEKLYKVLQKKYWKVKWEDVNRLHLTLAFLGNVTETKNLKLKSKNYPFDKLRASNSKLKIDEIKGCIKKALREIKPFTISFKGLGCFPDYDYPRVIWLGLKGDLQSSAALQKNIVKQLEKSDFYHDLPERIRKGLKKPFSAHITLGRVKKAKARERREIGRQLSKFRIMNYESRIMVDSVMVYESKIFRTGSVYKKILEVPIK